MKKIFASIVIAFALSLILFIPSAFANNMASDAVNGVRNAVGGAENAANDAAKSAAGAVKNGINTMNNGGQNAMNNVGNDVKNVANDGAKNGEYTATRTAAETNNNFLGFMGNNMWAWIVVGFVALVLIGIIWYYMAKQNNYSNHND